MSDKYTRTTLVSVAPSEMQIADDFMVKHLDLHEKQPLPESLKGHSRDAMFWWRSGSDSIGGSTSVICIVCMEVCDATDVGLW